jgi:hypothetical protein
MLICLFVGMFNLHVCGKTYLPVCGYTHLSVGTLICLWEHTSVCGNTHLSVVTVICLSVGNYGELFFVYLSMLIWLFIFGLSVGTLNCLSVGALCLSKCSFLSKEWLSVCGNVGLCDLCGEPLFVIQFECLFNCGTAHMSVCENSYDFLSCTEVIVGSASLWYPWLKLRMKLVVFCNSLALVQL